MSTPSATGGGRIASAQNVATPQPTSQFNTFSSPAPRSVPSPAAHRNQAGKSPFNTSSQNHPTGGSNASGPSRLLDASPGNAPNFDSPAGMVPSLSNMGFGDGHFNMTFNASGMSGLNMGSSLGGRIDEQERRRRLESIVTTLRKRYPRLSPEGVEIVGQRLGMDILLDPAQGRRRDGTRTCTLAGETIAVEIGFKQDNRVETVEVVAPGTSVAVAQHIQSASHVLKADLTEPDMLPIMRNLKKFSHNLERLSKLDKLNGSTNSQSFSCFEAISGVYTSLRRLFDHEKKAAEILIDSKKNNREARIEREVMSKKSGRPIMNSRNIVGLSVDYWMQRRSIFPAEAFNPGDRDAMDIDSNVRTDPSPEVPDQKVFSLLIECESCPNELFQPVRVSNAWISDTVEKGSTDPNDVFGPTVDWLDPPPTYISAAVNADIDAMVLDVGNKLPNIRFVAKLNPPLILPTQIVEAILASVGLQPEPGPMPLYHNALLGITEVDQMEFMGREKTIRNIRQTLARRGNIDSADICHRSYLTPKNPVFSRTLEEVPFSHPRQIVEMLPVLRQWAFINSLLVQSFASKIVAAAMEDLPTSDVDVTFDALFTRFGVRFPVGDVVLSKTDILDTFNKSMKDILLENGGKLQNETDFEACFVIGSNGDITMSDQHMSNSLKNASVGTSSSAEAQNAKNGEEFKSKLNKLARYLDIGGDLDMWVEQVKYSMLLKEP